LLQTQLLKKMKTRIFRQPVIEDEFITEKTQKKYLQEYTEQDENGNILLQIEYLPDGTIEQKTERVFQNNKLIKERILGLEDELIEDKRWEYDENGKLISEKQYYLDGTHDTTLIRYDEEGRIIEKRTVDENGEEEEKERLTFINGKLVKQTLIDSSGNIESDVEIHYDEEGRMILQKSINMEGEEESLTLEYDASGRIYRQITRNAQDKVIERNTYTYGEHHLPIQIHEESRVKNNTAKISYNSNNQVIKHEVFDLADTLINSVTRNYDEKGRIISSEILIHLPERRIREHYRLIYQYEE